MINKLWFFLIVIGIGFGFFNNKDMSEIILNSSNEAYKACDIFLFAEAVHCEFPAPLSFRAKEG